MLEGGRLRFATDDELERVLSGRAPGDEDAALGGFLAEIREAYAEPPSEETRRRHLAAMAAARANRRGDAARSRRPRWSGPLLERTGGKRPRRARGGRESVLSRGRLAAGLAGAVLLLPLGTAGLATAGIALPDAFRAPFDAAGITLPNQSSAEDVRAVIDATPSDERGCAFGQRVAKAAGGEASSDEPCSDAGRSPARVPGHGARRSAAGDARRPAAGFTGGSGSRGAAEPAARGAAPGRAPLEPAAGDRNASEAAERTAGDSVEGRPRDGAGLGRAGAGAPPEGGSTGQGGAEQGPSSRGSGGQASASAQGVAGEREPSGESPPPQPGAPGGP